MIRGARAVPFVADYTANATASALDAYLRGLEPSPHDRDNHAIRDCQIRGETGLAVHLVVGTLELRRVGLRGDCERFERWLPAVHPAFSAGAGRMEPPRVWLRRVLVGWVMQR